MTTKGERIKELRKQLGMKQDEFANQIGISRILLSYIENGQKSLTERNAKFIVEHFKINPEWLETGEGNMFVESSLSDKLYKFVDESISENGDMLQILKLLSNIKKQP